MDKYHDKILIYMYLNNENYKVTQRQIKCKEQHLHIHLHACHKTYDTCIVLLAGTFYPEYAQKYSISHQDKSLLYDTSPCGTIDSCCYFLLLLQCIRHLLLPTPPRIPLFLILIHKTEVPWLKNLPLRLLLAIGKQHNSKSRPTAPSITNTFFHLQNSQQNRVCPFNNITKGNLLEFR